MKKTYESPEILFEDFTLSVNIASGCDIRVNGALYNECGLTFGRKTYFMEGINGCKNYLTDGGAAEGYDMLCYHVPIETADLFNS